MQTWKAVCSPPDRPEFVVENRARGVRNTGHSMKTLSSICQKIYLGNLMQGLIAHCVKCDPKLAVVAKYNMHQIGFIFCVLTTIMDMSIFTATYVDFMFIFCGATTSLLHLTLNCRSQKLTAGPPGGQLVNSDRTACYNQQPFKYIFPQIVDDTKQTTKHSKEHALSR